jgi:hypothetical protein
MKKKENRIIASGGNEEFDKKALKDIETIDTILHNYESRGKDLLYLIRELQKIELLASLSDRCSCCRTPTNIALARGADVFNLKMTCFCSKLTTSLIKGTIFQNSFRSVIDQLLLLQGYLFGVTSKALAERIDINESAVRSFQDNLADRFLWFNEKVISFSKLLSEDSQDNFRFGLVLKTLCCNKEKGTYYESLGVMQLTTGRIFLSLPADPFEDESIFEAVYREINEVIPEDPFNKLIFLSGFAGERDKIKERYPSAAFLEDFSGSEEGVMKSALFRLNEVFESVQVRFKQIRRGKNSKNLQKIVNEINFRLNSKYSLLDFCSVNIEQKYQDYLSEKMKKRSRRFNSGTSSKTASASGETDADANVKQSKSFSASTDEIIDISSDSSGDETEDGNEDNGSLIVSKETSKTSEDCASSVLIREKRLRRKPLVVSFFSPFQCLVIVRY